MPNTRVSLPKGGGITKRLNLNLFLAFIIRLASANLLFLVVTVYLMPLSSYYYPLAGFTVGLSPFCCMYLHGKSFTMGALYVVSVTSLRCVVVLPPHPLYVALNCKYSLYFTIDGLILTMLSNGIKSAMFHGLRGIPFCRGTSAF